ncbi:hypothetical protein LY76DRAFT_220498 [Colletotrichum caudatum]|nr:hypothetical protein LY76DRAFT_220498 [Colletotrichum caudatum]
MGARNRQRSMSAADTSPPPDILTSLPPLLPIRLLWTTLFAAFPPQVSQRKCLAGSRRRPGVSSPISAACGAGPHTPESSNTRPSSFVLDAHKHAPRCAWRHLRAFGAKAHDVDHRRRANHKRRIHKHQASTHETRAPYPASIDNQHLYKDANGLKYGRSLLIFFIMVGDLSSSPNALV